MNKISVRKLSDAERELREQCEETIRAGLTGFVEVGQALMVMRDNRLYREQYATFEDYCAAEFQLSRARGYQLMDAARVVSTIVDSGLPRPANEAQARALGAVPDAQRAEVWQKALDQTNGKPTAAAVDAAAGREKTSPGTADPEDGAEGASDNSGSAVPSDSPKNTPADHPEPSDTAGSSDGRQQRAGADAGRPEEDHPGSADPGEAEDKDGESSSAADVTSPSAPSTGPEAPASKVPPGPVDGREQQDSAGVSGPAAPAPALVDTPIGMMPAGFAKTLDRFAPDPNPNREWQKAFLQDVFAMRRMLRKYGAEEIAEKADEQLLAEFANLAADAQDKQREVAKAQIARVNANVYPLRSVK